MSEQENIESGRVSFNYINAPGELVSRMDHVYLVAIHGIIPKDHVTNTRSFYHSNPIYEGCTSHFFLDSVIPSIVIYGGGNTLEGFDNRGEVTTGRRENIFRIKNDNNLSSNEYKMWFRREICVPCEIIVPASKESPYGQVRRECIDGNELLLVTVKIQEK